MLQKISIALFSVVVLISNAWGKSTEPQLRLAKTYVQSKSYHKAIRATKPLLDSLALDTVEEIVLAHGILGASYCELGDQAKAIDHFKSLITFSPRETVDSLVTSSLCAQIYTDLQTGGTGSIQASNAHSVRIVEGTDELLSEGDGTWKQYVPFGTGQFANGQREKGWTFLAGESVMFSGALTNFILFQNQRNSDGTFQDASKASTYRTLYWSFLGAGIGIAAWGIIDAILVQNRIKKREPSGPYKGFAMNSLTGISYHF